MGSQINSRLCGSITVLVVLTLSFVASNTRAQANAHPVDGLTLGRDGNFYGTTCAGVYGNGEGTVFKITPTGILTTIYRFNGKANGLYLGALTLGKDGNFYGTSSDGGAYGDGTAVKITPTGKLTLLHSFRGAVDGQMRGGGAAQLTLGEDGNLYGMAYWGGPHREGTVFRITTDGKLTVLHAFGASGTDGACPAAALTLLIDGSFYGSTATGGLHGCGTLFRITADGKLTTLYHFSGGRGRFTFPLSLTLGHDGWFYG